MPSIRVHSLYEAFVNFTIASPRPEAVPSHIIPNASLHDELAAKLRKVNREYRHLAENENWVPAAQQIATYLPVNTSLPVGQQGFFAVRTLDPAGSLVEVNEDFFLDVLRVRYAMVFAVLPASLMSDEGEAFERYWQKAWKDLLIASGFIGVFIPGDQLERDDNKTTIDVQIEMGAAKSTMRFDKSPS